MSQNHKIGQNTQTSNVKVNNVKVGHSWIWSCWHFWGHIPHWNHTFSFIVKVRLSGTVFPILPILKAIMASSRPFWIWSSWILSGYIPTWSRTFGFMVMVRYLDHYGLGIWHGLPDTRHIKGNYGGWSAIWVGQFLKTQKAYLHPQRDVCVCVCVIWTKSRMGFRDLLRKRNADNGQPDFWDDAITPLPNFVRGGVIFYQWRWANICPDRVNVSCLLGKTVVFRCNIATENWSLQNTLQTY